MNDDTFTTQVAEFQEKLDDVFSYHAPDEGDLKNYAAIREASKRMAEVILLTCPASADRSAALRHVREAMMTANASIALKGRNL